MNLEVRLYKQDEEMYYQGINWILRNQYKRTVFLLPNVVTIKRFQRYCQQRKIPIVSKSGVAQGVVLDYYKHDENYDNIDAVCFMYTSLLKLELNKSKTIKNPTLYLDLNKDDNSVSFKQKITGAVDMEYKNLKNHEIYEYFMRTFDCAEKKIDIISPWISRSVVDRTFISKLEGCLQIGVSIRIIYGIGDDTRNDTSREIAQELAEKFYDYGNKFNIKESNTHVKLLLCDDKYMIMGSYNFLSFKGTYDGEDKRQESAIYETSKERIREMRRSYFG